MARKRTGRIRRGLDGVEKLHVADIIEIDLLLQHHGETLSVQAHGKNGGREGELAYCRFSLPSAIQLAMIPTDTSADRGLDSPWCS